MRVGRPSGCSAGNRREQQRGGGGSSRGGGRTRREDVKRVRPPRTAGARGRNGRLEAKARRPDAEYINAKRNVANKKHPLEGRRQRRGSASKGLMRRHWIEVARAWRAAGRFRGVGFKKKPTTATSARIGRRRSRGSASKPLVGRRRRVEAKARLPENISVGGKKKTTTTTTTTHSVDAVGEGAAPASPFRGEAASWKRTAGNLASFRGFFFFFFKKNTKCRARWKTHSVEVSVGVTGLR